MVMRATGRRIILDSRIKALLRAPPGTQAADMMDSERMSSMATARSFALQVHVIPHPTLTTRLRSL